MDQVPIVSMGSLIAVLAALVSGGGLATFVAYLKYRNTGKAERESIVVDASARAVEMMDLVLKARQEELRAALGRIRELEESVAETTRQIAALRDELSEEKEARADVEKLLAAAMRRRDAMTEEIRQLRAQVNRLDPDVLSNGGFAAGDDDAAESAPPRS